MEQVGGEEKAEASDEWPFLRQGERVREIGNLQFSVASGQLGKRKAKIHAHLRWLLEVDSKPARF
jgi:hypothetical protein